MRKSSQVPGSVGRELVSAHSLSLYCIMTDFPTQSIVFWCMLFDSAPWISWCFKTWCHSLVSFCVTGSNQASSTRYGMALQNRVISFLNQNPLTLLWSPTLAAPKHPQTATFPPPCLTDVIKNSSNIFSFVLIPTNVLCDPNTSNLDLSLTLSFIFLHLVYVLSPTIIVSFYWPISDTTFLCFSA